MTTFSIAPKPDDCKLEAAMQVDVAEAEQSMWSNSRGALVEEPAV